MLTSTLAMMVWRTTPTVRPGLLLTPDVEAEQHHTEMLEARYNERRCVPLRGPSGPGVAARGDVPAVPPAGATCPGLHRDHRGRRGPMPWTTNPEGQIEWKHATQFERNHPLVLSLADEFELPAEQVDDLWEWAADL